MRLVALLIAVTAPLFHIRDARIDEASGIAVGIASPGVVYVHNDSGDSARFFALNARTGATLATYTVPGATNVDWEDMAVARDRRGVPSVWLADIGDNDGNRDEVRVYRVDEPHVRAGVDTATSAPEVWRLRYPDGPTDAESLAVAPGGVAYIVTKSLLGASAVYHLPARPGGVQTLRQVGRIRFTLTATPGGPNPVGELTATGASLSHDGTVLAVRTYTDAYVWWVRRGDVAAALGTEPIRVTLPRQPQGEGIAIDGSRLLIDSEGVGSAVYAVALPRLRAAPQTTAAPASSPTSTASSRGSSGHSYTVVIVVVGIVVAVALGAVVTLRRCH